MLRGTSDLDTRSRVEGILVVSYEESVNLRFKFGESISTQSSSITCDSALAKPCLTVVLPFDSSRDFGPAVRSILLTLPSSLLSSCSSSDELEDESFELL